MQEVPEKEKIRENQTSEGKNTEPTLKDNAQLTSLENATAQRTNEVMGSVESAENAEGAAEGFQEDGRQQAKQTAQQQKVKNPAQLSKALQPLPSPKKMQQQIAQAIRKEIRKDESKVFLTYVGLKKIPPHNLALIIAKIRQLKDLLASLLESSKEVLTGLYLKWVRQIGR